MYADDLVEWLMTIATHANHLCPVYNVGSNQTIMMGDLAKIVAKEFGIEALIPEIMDATIDRYVPSIDKVKREIGLCLRNNLNVAIRKTIQCVLSE